MDVLVFVLGLCLLSTAIIAEDDIFELTNDNPTISWAPDSSQSINVQVEKGCQIQVNVTLIDLDGESDNSVTIAGVNDDGEEQDALMFTYTMSGKPGILYNTNKMKAISFINERANFLNQVIIHFTKIGEAEIPTTTQSTSTSVSMPTPAPEEPATLTVYIWAELFKNKQVKRLRNAITSMGIHYCAAKGCPRNGSITNSNVKIYEVKDCSLLWNDHEKCHSLTFALPIFKLDDYGDEWRGYQLSRSHLKNMWDMFAAEELKKVNLSIYDQPDIDRTTKYGLIVICVVTLTLLVLILILRSVVGKIQRKRKRRSDDTAPIINERACERNRHSLTQHYLQEVPPLFYDYNKGYGGNPSDFHHPTRNDRSLNGIINLDKDIHNTEDV